MKAASLKEIKAELSTLPPERLLDLCMHIVKFKKENKELLTYLLFDAEDELAYIRGVKSHIDKLFQDINYSNFYFAKKTIRKILRIINKYIKYSGLKQTEVELLIHFCKNLKGSGISFRSNIAISNIYRRQLEKIHKSLAELHEDLQFDYSQEIRLLE